MEIDKKSLVDLLGVQLKEESSDSRNKSIEIGVNKKLAKLFGAKLFLSYDWNLFSNPKYSLEEIQKVLDDSGIKVSAQSLVEEKLRVNLDWEDNYSFKKVIDPKEFEAYVLSYTREVRPISYSDWR